MVIIMARVINFRIGKSVDFEEIEEMEPQPYYLPEPTGRPVAVGPRFGVRAAAQQLYQAKVEERKRAIAKYPSTPIGYVWQFSKKLPDYLTKIPIPRPAPSSAEILARFPEIQRPIPAALEPVYEVPPPPKSTKVYRGEFTYPDGRIQQLWEDVTGKQTTAPEPPPPRTIPRRESTAPEGFLEELPVIVHPETVAGTIYGQPEPTEYGVAYENLGE